MSSKPVVIGGKLKFKSKGSKPKAVAVQSTTSETSSSSSSLNNNSNNNNNVSNNKRSRDEEEEEEDLTHLTESEKRFRMSKIEKEKKDIKKLVKQTYRDRLNDFNEKLSKQSDHNDIPRVSAAGNG